MIKIEIEGLKYNIYFEYHIDENTGITTTCYIDPDIGKEEIISTGLGMCTRYYKDTPNKNLGRKIALERALDDAEWGKPRRTLVWDVYNEKVGLKKRKTGADLILGERNRQITEEGFGVRHDDDHINGEIVVYAQFLLDPKNNEHLFPSSWDEKWKTKAFSRPQKENFIKAGALIAAEYDRIERMEKR